MRTPKRLHLRAMTFAVGGALVAMVLVPQAASAAPPAAASSASVQAQSLQSQTVRPAASPWNRPISRQEVLKRAKYWLDHRVPYSQSSYYPDINHAKNYRQDCSGFISMAWKMDRSYVVSVPWNSGLVQFAHDIKLSQLQSGDVMVKMGVHIAMFHNWANSAHTAMVVWEESRPGEPAEAKVWGASYFRNYRPMAYNRITGSTTAPPPPTSTSYAWPVVKFGAHGPRVNTVQSLLSAHGYALANDGIFGRATLAAVKRFQASRHLAVDGIVGSKTWSALVTPISKGATGNSVRGLQVELNANGAKLKVDGSFGNATLAAVKRYQKSHRLSVDGVVGPKTWNSLVHFH